MTNAEQQQNPQDGNSENKIDLSMHEPSSPMPRVSALLDAIKAKLWTGRKKWVTATIGAFAFLAVITMMMSPRKASQVAQVPIQVAQPTRPAASQVSRKAPSRSKTSVRRTAKKSAATSSAKKTTKKKRAR